MSHEINNRQGIRDIPEICTQLGIENVVICPGSRSAPLIIAFTKYSSIHCTSIVDERSAGYFALGIAQNSRKPVALVCTSGTAVLNFAPAVAEAYYQEIPLVVFTADRPAEWIDQADGQTIRQRNIYGNYCKAAFEVPVETNTSDDVWFSARTVAQAINTAIQHPAGPVQVNIPLREPLYAALPSQFSNSHIIHEETSKPVLSEDQKKKFSQEWERYSKKLIVVGMLHPDHDLTSILDKLARRSDVAVIAENLSNTAFQNIIDTPESFFAALEEDEKAHFQPDLLITIGHSLVSKRAKQYLRKFQPDMHWHLDPVAKYIDTFKSLQVNIQVQPLDFLSEMSKVDTVIDSNFSLVFSGKLEQVRCSHRQYLEKCEFSDLVAVDNILSAIPPGSVVHFSNSTPVRYSQLFQTRRDLVYFSNRGTSGIDGCTSTAVGSAFASQKPVYLVTGDLAFIYDSNGLWNSSIRGNLKIIVLNNHGGNIFRLIETSDEIQEIRGYFETPQQVNLKKLAGAFGFSVISCENSGQLEAGLQQLIASVTPSILEISTDFEVNTKIFKGYYKHLKYTSVS